MNMVSERASHPLAMNGESLQMLAHWLESTAMQQVEESDWRRMMIERYPAGLFSEAELEALWEVMEG